jgi:hypothetical protein
MSNIKYVGMDVHKSITVIVVLNELGLLIQRMDGRKIDDSFIAESFTVPTPRGRRAGGCIIRRRSTGFRARSKPSCPLPSCPALKRDVSGLLCSSSVTM